MKLEILAISGIYIDEEKVLEELVDHLNGRNRVSIVAGDLGVLVAPKREKYRERVRTLLKKLLSISKKVLFIPGEMDSSELGINHPDIVNIDGNSCMISLDIKVGFFGLGGAPARSLVAEGVGEGASPYIWDEAINLQRDRKLGILVEAYEELSQHNPEFKILVTHSPPYKITDKSIPLSLRRRVPDELIEDRESGGEERGTYSTNPKHLGSKVIKRFVHEREVDIHLFGHVYKNGGKHRKKESTHFFNLSHLSPEPYKLTGRKYLTLNLSKNEEKEINFSFDSVVDKKLPFYDFVEKYL